MTQPTELRPTVADESRLPPSSIADIVADEAAWVDLEARLAPLEILVPRSVPPWRGAALGVLTLVGVGIASLLALVGVATIERWLIPNGDAADVSHGVALGGFVVVWGLLSLGLLAGATRLTLGRGSTLARGDLAIAGLVLLLLGGWTIALHAWNVGVAGYVEPDLIGRGTYLWPGIVVYLAVALAAVRLTRDRIALALLVLVALAIGALVVETLGNGLGAIADGDVSETGVAVGVLSATQLVVLGSWWWRTVRTRLRG